MKTPEGWLASDYCQRTSPNTGNFTVYGIEAIQRDATEELRSELADKIAELERLKADLAPVLGRHSGDCTIYSSLISGYPFDGICTCGYGWNLVRTNADYSQMLSDERQDRETAKSKLLKLTPSST